MKMNSHAQALLFFILLLATFFTTSPTALPQSDSEKKVSLALYYETLCPYSAKFIINYLNKLVNDDEMMKIVDLRLVPYGNAQIINGTIICQHGEWECALNKVEACVMDVYPSLGQYFPFINCVGEYTDKGNETKIEECFLEVAMDPNPVLDCYDNGRGDVLEFQYGNETDSLVPPHEYVPWVTVNGVPLYEDYENFIVYICDAYNGTEPPKACNGLASIENNQYKSDEQKKSAVKGCKRRT